MGIMPILEIDLTLDDIISTLRKCSKKFSQNAHDLCNAFERFLENPLREYNENTTDLFLHALGNSYNVNMLLNLIEIPVG